MQIPAEMLSLLVAVGSIAVAIIVAVGSSTRATKGDATGLSRAMGVIDAKLDGISENIKELKTAVKKDASDIAELKVEVAALKAEMMNLKGKTNQRMNELEHALLSEDTYRECK